MPSKDEDHTLAVRLAVQQIITSQVVRRDFAERDRLIVEHLETFGDEVAACVVGFIYCHAADEVEVEVAEDRFFYLLTRIARIVELLAAIEGLTEAEVVKVVAGVDYGYDADGVVATEEAASAVMAMQAAQACVIAHHFVRRGAPPWGIQKSLDLVDMTAVVGMLGLLLHDLSRMFEPEDQEALTRTLLADVEIILNAMAQLKGVPVSTVVSDYFVGLMSRE